ncbi:MAG: amylo-alpha-1,6-glucosidase [Candidatus Woesearchaeota archaeon]
MIISHRMKKEKISKNVFNTVERNAALFMLSVKGHYLSLPINPSDQLTNFCGWFNSVEKSDSSDGFSMYKSIDNIYIDKSPTEIINDYISTERISNDSSEKFKLVKNGMIYEVDSYNGDIHLDLDFREIFDTDDKGRIYNLFKHDDLIIVEYNKFSDDSLTILKGKKYLAIKGVTDYLHVNNWSQRSYNYDMLRKNTANFYVYNALKISCRNNIKIYFAFSEDMDSAIQKVDDIFLNKERIDIVFEHYLQNVLSVKNDIYKIAGKDTAFAYTGCVHAIDSLSMQLPSGHKLITGMWAGLPWFFQYWSRDELISVISPMLEYNYDYSKEVLMKYLAEIMSDGRLSNRYPAAALGSADGIGWLFKRLQDFLFLCERRNNFHNYFTLYDLNYIRERLKFSIKMLLKEHSRGGLIINGKQETWMDTFSAENNDKDYREGARIEIQALFLNMLRLMNMLENYLANKFVKKNDVLVRVGSNDMNTDILEEETKKIVRESFLRRIDGKLYLNDGYDCPLSDVIRPNIFLAYYIYPDLLSPKEWIEVFDNALSRLWCEWDMGENLKGGGLSTIDKMHPLYQPTYTGIDNKSYHRGDSWFWVNNVAAVAMYRLDKEHYKEHILKIITASSQDILYWGFIGYSSELASSGWFKSGGCLCQTWSIATFIELMHEVYIE